MKRKTIDDVKKGDKDLSGADLHGAELQSIDLNNANLRGADLRLARLSGADLSMADLRESNLGDAQLWRTNLSGAYLTLADLSFANLESAILDNACLRRTALYRVDFYNASLRGTDFSYSNFHATALSNVDLSEAIGLRLAEHSGRSPISTDTLLRSGKLPEVFLRGCGLPESLINYVPSLMNESNAIDFYSCFISYSHADKHFARRLHDQLQAKGVRCWLDEKQILPGENIYEEVDRGLKLYDKVLLCASKDSLNSWWVERELKQAFEREMKLRKERESNVLSIVPLNLDGHLFEWDSPHGPSLRERLAPDFTKDEEGDYDEKFEQQLQQVIKALRADPGRKQPPPEPKL